MPVLRAGQYKCLSCLTKFKSFFWVNTNKALFDIYKSFFQKKKREEYFFIVLCGGKIKPNYKKKEEEKL